MTDTARSNAAPAEAPPHLPTARSCPFSPPDAQTALRETEPVSQISYLDGAVGWLITRHSDVRRVLADHHNFSSSDQLMRFAMRPPQETDGEAPPPQPGMFIFKDPPDHGRLRKKLTGQFTVRRMRLLEARVVEIVDEHLDAMQDRGAPADLVEHFAKPIPSKVICELLGVPYEDHEFFQDAAAKIFQVDAPPEATEAAATALDEYLFDLTKRKRTAPVDDMISGLTADEDLSDEEIAGMGMLLLLAGHDTTANMLGLGAFALLRHPDQLRLLREDPALMDNAVEELLRYLAIAQFDVSNRTAVADVEVGGKLIKAGDPVTIAYAPANRDPERFDDPERLDVTRKATGHIAFGHGIHQCLGQQLARVEMRVAFAALIRRFPNLALAVEPEAVPMRSEMSIYGVHELPVTW
ncbi:MAG: cytochrome P450 [Stackebrandtia sp.]